MTTAWAHLPNAALIDEVLASARAHPGKWSAAWHATWAVSQDVAWYTARGAARGAAWDAAWDAAWGAARGAARSTIAALIAYDDAGQFMKIPVEHLQRLYRIDPHPMYWLLQPAAVVFAEG